MNEQSIACVRVKDSDAEPGVEQPKNNKARQLTLGQFWKGRCFAGALTPLLARLRRAFFFYVYLQDRDIGSLRPTIRKCGRWVTWLNFYQARR